MIFFRRTAAAVMAVVLLSACSNIRKASESAFANQSYYRDSAEGIKTGGIKLVEINTPKGKFKVWTKRIGNNPKIKLLLLNGGPGATHEYFECLESFLPKEGIEFIYYDQLGTGNSDNPQDESLWDLPRYVEEVEQVRVALGLTKDNFYLMGHSWGGILAGQYSLKYQQNLKGLIISNMMMSAPAYGRYANEVLAGQIDPKALAEIREIEKKGDFDNPQYMELLLPNFYTKHIVRLEMDQWPEPVGRSLGKINHPMYTAMQGPSEFGISGKLAKWDITEELPKISVPVLSIGAKYDTMDPNHMKWIAGAVQNGSFLYCSNGSHMSMYDDQKTYMSGLIQFIKDIDAGKTKSQFSAQP